MKAVRLHRPGGLVIDDGLPEPQADRGEILIRVYAAGVTTAELEWEPSNYTPAGDERQFPVPCHEFSGVVAAVGEGKVDFAVGEEVYGFNDWYHDGALAEYCVTSPNHIAPKPRSLNHAEAAAVPIGALTAWQGLFERAALTGGHRVLIHGGAGAVGAYAVQLAHWEGAHVIATASAANAAWVRELGAHDVIDYTSARFEDSVRDVDIVFDTVGGETLERSWSIVKPNAHVVTIADPQTERAARAFFIVQPSRAQLTHIADMIDRGELKPVLNRLLPFDQALSAFEHARPHRGKTVVAVTPSALGTHG